MRPISAFNFFFEDVVIMGSPHFFLSNIVLLGAEAFAQFFQKGHHSNKVSESAADLICQVASYESCRILLTQSGIIEALASLLEVQNNEIRSGSLLALVLNSFY
jgi:hypothetical protein